MARSFKKASPKGFTLVELLIVVAIIGVLSSIGVPTFRKMVSKAKKSEAKVGLGGLFTVESAFFTEYNVYGNRLNRVGFELEGTQRYYSIGFPTAACANQTLRPAAADPGGVNLAAAYVTYYAAEILGNPAAVPPIAPDLQQTVISRGVALSAAQAAAGGQPAVLAQTCAAADVVANGTSYIASATGNIAPGVNANGPVANVAGSQDVWTMTDRRVLANTVDGAR